jgi:hypothetical protein
LGIPLVSDRDLVKELTALSAGLLKPVQCLYGKTGKNEGMSPIVFGDSHVKVYSANRINSLESGIQFRFR